ncbi:Uncharacterized protein dnm_071080 [Desulfonema magnum]|uniref:Uncharacterized protein n=1 Tax=Desulfonema magnum TaxID=45655 RepID=A0A975BSQ9_9BACT|nr:Uncharacterized protein dnm_071080 [Desulfonema magnum]
MEHNPEKKHIAIIRDGYSDYCVIRQFVASIFEHHRLSDMKEYNFFDLESLNISEAMARYG